ncbi:MAG: hypothetical protein Q7R35_17475 [Elusimicrobiota bacterium]|nr:hypothetical protein [Elusimicrobiota bacterium]
MIIDYADFTRASNIIHWLQGGALLTLGAAEAYALENKGNKFVLAASLVLAVSGAAMFAAVLALPGGWSFAQLETALQVRRGFYLFIAFACLYGAAGLSLLMHEALGRRGGGWRAMSLALLALAGMLYFMMAGRVNEDAWRQVMVWHSAIGVTLLLAVAAKTADIFFSRRALHLAWAVLLLITGLQLASYRETASAFAPRLVTLESAPEVPPAAQPAPLKNAKPADKKRPGH